MKATFHLPGLFEIYGAPAGCPWDGGRAGFGENRAEDAAELMRQYGISARLTFSNSLLREEHLSDGACNALCALFEKSGTVPNGVILTSDLLSRLLFCLVHHKGAAGFQTAREGIEPRGISLRGAGFSAEQGL